MVTQLEVTSASVSKVIQEMASNALVMLIMEMSLLTSRMYHNCDHATIYELIGLLCTYKLYCIEHYFLKQFFTHLYINWIRNMQILNVHRMSVAPKNICSTYL